MRENILALYVCAANMALWYIYLFRIWEIAPNRTSFENRQFYSEQITWYIRNTSGRRQRLGMGFPTVHVVNESSSTIRELTTHLARATKDVTNAIAASLTTLAAQKASNYSKEAVLSCTSSAKTGDESPFAVLMLTCTMLNVLARSSRGGVGNAHGLGSLRLSAHWGFSRSSIGRRHIGCKWRGMRELFGQAKWSAAVFI